MLPFTSDRHVEDERGRRYECLRKVGAGAQGAVYECAGADGGRYALKVYAASARREDRERVDRLVALELGRRHPVLAAPVARLRSPSCLGHLAPWSPGSQLAELYAQPGWTLQEGFCIGAALARGAAELESAGLAHGDIQPGNVHLARVETHWEPRFVDFDNAIVPGAPPPAFVPPHLYQAPEVLAGRLGDLPSDRWSLAVLIHELTLLKRPFMAFEADADSYRRAVTAGSWSEDPLSARHGARPGLPGGAVGPGLASLFRRAFRGPRQERPSAAEWATSLRAAAARTWACDTCGGQLVMGSDTRSCCYADHDAGGALALTVAGRRLPLERGTTAITRELLGGDRSVSKLHAVVQRVGLGHVIEDRSSYGTSKWVDGRGWVRIRRNALSPGDRLLMGTVEVGVAAG